MGRLTEEMRRLAEEIAELHASRGKFMQDLRATVLGMRSRFHHAHAEMADAARAARLAFVSGVVESVAALRHEFSADLLGAHQAWSGLSSAPRKKRGDSAHGRARGD